MFSILTFLFGAGLSIIAGVFVLNIVFKERRWKINRTDHQHEALAQHGSPAFEPMDLGPSPMKWPSETPRKTTKKPDKLWPSETWEDPYFGPNAKKMDGWGTKTKESTKPSESTPEQDFFELEPPEKSRKRTKQRSQKQKSTTQKRQAQKPKRQAQPQQRKAPPKPAQQRPTSSGPNLPSTAQVTQWVQEVGFAGAVDKIRQQTGWDFKQAAHFLAQKIRGN